MRYTPPAGRLKVSVQAAAQVFQSLQSTSLLNILK